MMGDVDDIRCEEIERSLATLLEPELDERWLEHLADCSRCRDLRYDVERLVEQVRDAGADFQPSAALEERLAAALAAREQAPSGGGDAPAPAAVPPPSGPAAEEEHAEPAPRAARATDEPPAPPAPPAPPLAPRPASPRAPQEQRGPGLPGPWRRFGVLALVAAAGAALWWRAREVPPQPPVASAADWQGTLTAVRAPLGAGEGGVKLCPEPAAPCTALAPGSSVPAGVTLRTEGDTLAEVKLTDGSVVQLERGTELSFGVGRSLRLSHGELVVDIAKAEAPATLQLPRGRVEVLGTKLGLSAGPELSEVEVSRGSVRLVDAQERSVVVRAGELGRLQAGAPPRVESSPNLASALAWSEALRDRDDEVKDPRGLGELRAKRPGTTEERADAVTLEQHHVKVRITGAVARTEVTEVFRNQTDDVLEGIFRFPLPPDAKIERLALEVDGKWEEGAFVDRDRAAAIWRGAITAGAPQRRPPPQEEIVWVPGPWRDPALLEWQRGGRFELRIFPIPRRGARKIALAYTQVVAPSAGSRRYVYPLAHDRSGKLTVADFSVDVQLRGYDRDYPVLAKGYPLRQDLAPDVAQLSYSRTSFQPSGDLLVEYALAERDAELSAWSFSTGAAPQPSPGAPTGAVETPPSGAFVALALRPRLPRAERATPLRLMVTLDSSRSMFGESFQRAARLAARTVAELSEQDEVGLMWCATRCRRWDQGFVPGGPGAATLVEQAALGVTPEGASDPVAAVLEARAAVRGAGDYDERVLLIGDGTPTAGPIRPASIERSLRRGERGAAVIAVGVGVASDSESLAALARGGGGAALPWISGETLAEASYRVLSTLRGSVLRDVTVDLPPGATEITPARLDSMIAGGELIVAARLERPTLQGDVVVRGRVGQQPFERRIPLALTATSAAGHAFVPRLWAGTRLVDLERDGSAEARREAVLLSSSFDVASKYTSLLVLESPAMFRAFGLDNRRSLPEFTGEAALETVSASGEPVEELASAEEESAAASDGDGVPAVAAKKSASERPMGFGSAAPAPASTVARGAVDSASRPLGWDDVPRERQVPMRRIWKRRGSIEVGAARPRAAGPTQIAAAERAARERPESRDALKQLYQLYAIAGDVERAAPLAERWAEKEPLDPEALTARADLAARRGQRDEALLGLGSVVDVRPGDIKAQQRLARLWRWAGRPELGCRHSQAVSELHPSNVALLVDAVRCLRRTGDEASADGALSAAEEPVRRAAERRLEAPSDDAEVLSGDLRIEASWSADVDLDLSLMHPRGHRVSWLGAPTREVITARDVLRRGAEGLALRGAEPGDYTVEILRAAPGGGPVSGSVSLEVAGVRRTIPFVLTGERTQVALVSVKLVPELVPLRGW